LTPQQLALVQSILCAQNGGANATDRLKLSEQQLKEIKDLCEKWKGSSP
jgi:hypothetical protein